MKNREPWNFCETPKEKCTMNYCDENGCQNRKRNYVEVNDIIADVSSITEFKVWDELFGILAWKYILTKSGDMYLDGEEVYNELKDKFELKRK